MMDLPLIWAFIIAFAVFAYVVMDGFDLGIGVLFPGFAVGEERDSAMNSIAPVWDGNETWLVLGGGGLFEHGAPPMGGSSVATIHPERSAPAPRPKSRDLRHRSSTMEELITVQLKGSSISFAVGLDMYEEGEHP